VATKESGVAVRELVVAEMGGMDGPAAPRSARVHCSGGTYHVAWPAVIKLATCAGPGLPRWCCA